jgi:hypothetical protein
MAMWRMRIACCIPKGTWDSFRRKRWRETRNPNHCLDAHQTLFQIPVILLSSKQRHGRGKILLFVSRYKLQPLVSFRHPFSPPFTLTNYVATARIPCRLLSKLICLKCLRQNQNFEASSTTPSVGSVWSLVWRVCAQGGDDVLQILRHEQQRGEVCVCGYHRKFEKDKNLVVTLAHFSSKF